MYIKSRFYDDTDDTHIMNKTSRGKDIYIIRTGKRNSDRIVNTSRKLVHRFACHVQYGTRIQPHRSIHISNANATIDNNTTSEI